MIRHRRRPCRRRTPHHPLVLSLATVLGIAALGTAPAFAQDGALIQTDTMTITRNGQSVVVQPADDSVTIVVFANAEVSQPVTLSARYVRGGWYWATSMRGVLPRGVGVKRIPWHPMRLTIGPSRELDVGPGDIVVIRYPQDYGRAGWLRRIS